MTRRITLGELYRDDSTLFDPTEALGRWLDDAGMCALDTAFTVREMALPEAGRLVGMDGETPVLELFRTLGRRSKSRAIVKEKMRDFEEGRIIVIEGDKVLDGNHHLVAALQLGRPVLVIDMDDALEDEPDEHDCGPG